MFLRLARAWGQPLEAYGSDQNLAAALGATGEETRGRAVQHWDPSHFWQPTTPPPPREKKQANKMDKPITWWLVNPGLGPRSVYDS